MWWNVAGFLAAVTITFFLSFLKPARGDKDISDYILRWPDIMARERDWIAEYIVLIVYFFVIISFMLIL